MTYWSALGLAGAALVAGWLTFVAWRKTARLRLDLERLSRDAARVALGEQCLPVTGYERTAFQRMAAALTRIGRQLQAAESIIDDRDRQLATMRGLADIIYWETNTQGRFVRVEFEASLPRRQRLDLLQKEQFDRATPLDDARWLLARRAIAEQRTFTGLLLRRIDADGRCVDVRESGQPRFAADGRFLGYAGVARVVDAARREGDEAARVAMETSPEATLIVSAADAVPEVRWINHAAEQLLGRRSAEIEGMAVHGLVAPDHADALAALGAAIRQRRPMRHRLAISNRYGERIEVDARLEPVEKNGSTMVLALDARSARAAVLRAHTREHVPQRNAAPGSSQQLEQHSRELEAIAYGIAHDLRAPLRVVDGYAKLMRDDCAGTLDVAGREHLERILTGCARMDKMIDGTLALAQASTRPLVVTPVDLARIARETLEALARCNPDRRVDIHIGERLDTHGDPTLLRTLIENLVGNAWKFTAKRERASISFDVRPDASQRPVFCVEDNGSGFDMRHADRLFGLFQRLHPESEFPGSGIGLAMVERIVQRHGGTVWAESEPGSGSRFCFTLQAIDLPAQRVTRPGGRIDLEKMGWAMGFEPTTTGITIRDSTPELRPPSGWPARQESNL